MKEMVIRACDKYGRNKKYRASFNLETNRIHWELDIEGEKDKLDHREIGCNVIRVGQNTYSLV
jgi:hypothetical protein